LRYSIENKLYGGAVKVENHGTLNHLVTMDEFRALFKDVSDREI
jgi:hypothetical protein